MDFLLPLLFFRSNWGQDPHFKRIKCKKEEGDKRMVQLMLKPRTKRVCYLVFGVTTTFISTVIFLPRIKLYFTSKKVQIAFKKEVYNRKNECS